MGRKTGLWTAGFLSALAVAASVLFYQKHEDARLLQDAVQSYMSGDLPAAVHALEKRRSGSRDPRAKDLYVRVLLEQGLSLLKEGHYERALHALTKAKGLAPEDEGLTAILHSLSERSLQRETKSPVSPEWLEKILEEKNRAWSPETAALLQEIRDSQAALSRHLDDQALSFQRDLTDLKRDFSKTTQFLIGFLLLAVFAVAAMVFFGVLMVQRHTRQASQSILDWLERSNRMDNGRLLRSPQSEKIAVVEAELVRQPDLVLAQNLLAPFLESHDPWVQAGAAKAMHLAHNSHALDILKSIWETQTRDAQEAVLWALAEIGKPDAVSALMAFTTQADEEIKRIGLRYLLHFQDSPQLPGDLKATVRSYLEEVRRSTDLIF